MFSRLGLLVNTVIQIRRKEKVILQNMPHRMPKLLLTQKCQQYFLNQKSENNWTDVHLHIVKLESGGQQLPVIKKNHSGNRFNLGKSSFY